MVGQSSSFSRLLLGCLILLLLYFLYMDAKLYSRIQNFPLRRNIDNMSVLDSNSYGSCDFSPLCDVTVKSIMLDHPNHYLFSPMATLFDKIFRIHEIEYITPNMISVFHVLIAVASAKCVASDSLVTRRVGVALFLIRSMLDELDGHVARARKNIHGEGSEIGSVGFFVDGLCDALGTTALLIGCLIYLKNNPPRRGYTHLQSLIPQVMDATKEVGPGFVYKGKITSKKVFQTLSCIGAQLLLSSTAWNRYIALYQDLLERRAVSDAQASCQIQAFRSLLMWVVAWLWRIFNPHALINALLVAVFCDKLWEFLCAIQYVGFLILVSIVCISEMHVQEVESFIYKTLTNSTAV
ncbi:ceramide phosphoethanolamine synthase [Schistocerca americana]|uniref:ceramide phosphoethanolamine synthase n=1 Tax=Schistocerca americana TaxID=7009 RepID=UPI001F500C20|nr:ceramide phosphoethanolamine synthase [Schistocerca americana]